MTAVERYLELVRKRAALEAEDDRLLEQMDKVWIEMTPAEMDIVDPAGKEFREKAREDRLRKEKEGS